MKIENFMQALKEYRSPLVFNPWRDYDPKCDISSDAPVIRAVYRGIVGTHDGTEEVPVGNGIAVQ